MSHWCKPSYSWCLHRNQLSKHQDLFHLQLKQNALQQSRRTRLYQLVNHSAQPLFSSYFASLGDKQLGVHSLLNGRRVDPMDF